ncbi:MAG: Tn3 family transposase [Elusimicrobiota bacterium]
MSTHIQILSKANIKAFDAPPKFDSIERNKFFRLPEWAKEFVDSKTTITTKVGFIMQLAYFKSTKKIFNPRNFFYEDDIKLIAKRFDIPLEEIKIQDFSDRAYNINKKLILEKYGFLPFDEKTRALLKEEAAYLASKHLKLEFMFISLVDFLKRKKIEIPSYHAISEIITEALIDYEKNLSEVIENNITDEQKGALEELFGIPEKRYKKEQDNLEIKRYKLTWLKKSYQSLREHKIKQNIYDLDYLKSLFFHLQPLIESLNLSPEVIKYYAYIVIKSQASQIYRRNEKKVLFLIAFIIHRFYEIQDTLMETLLQSVQSALTKTTNTHKEKFYEFRKTKSKAIGEISEFSKLSQKAFEAMEIILNSPDLSSDAKVDAIKKVIGQVKNTKYKELPEKINSLENFSKNISKNGDYYDVLEAQSLKLQRKVSEIVKSIEFDGKTSKKHLIEAIDYYKKTDKLRGNKVPLNFLDIEEEDLIFDVNGKFRISLYKALLFIKISDAIKSGNLNLNYSYKYLSFDNYLLPEDHWEANKDLILERAGLSKLCSFEKIKPHLEKEVKTLYEKVNHNIFTGKNKYIKFDSKGNMKNIITPKIDKEYTYKTSRLFSKVKFVSLLEILSTVNDVTNFLDPVKHWMIKDVRKNPELKNIIAGIIGYGCNIGANKIAEISRDINKDELYNTINWYFSIDNLELANNKIIEFVERLNLINLFKNPEGLIHTSSDGQKYNIAVESLNASYSYKYFGKGKGLSVYSFIDETHRLFYSTVINNSEKEATYVIDGLMHNDVIESEIHSTDSDGYSEIIFGLTHLLGISFAPRIKNLKDQHLYSFQKASELKRLAYKIRSQKKINTKIIEKNWDNILRFVATIKLKHTTASQLLHRLNSYSKQHPLYQALREFGRIIKTIFLLNYIDDVKLRQAIEKQLNKSENINKFANAVFHGNNQEFQQDTKEEQIIAENCKRLIENSIICWNYLYLSQRILEAKSKKQKQNIINTLKNGSIVVWQHVNLQGEYDFSEKTLKKSIKFNIPDILKVEIDA